MDQAILKRQGAEVPWEDVQGLLNYGYRYLPAGRYLFLTVEDPTQARAWLSALGPRLAHARTNPKDRAINVALTAGGLRKLGATEKAVASFSEAFGQGMVTPHRSRVLGDFGPNDPSQWRWGVTPERTPDVLLAVFGTSPDAARLLADGLMGEATGMRPLDGLDMEANLFNDRNHFGFVDGIAQPRIAGTPASDGTVHDGDIAVGEFLLGQPNQRGQYDPVPWLGSDAPKAGERAFGMNGTYLVFRQLDQDPGGFHDFCVSQDAEHPDRVSSWMVGRWPDGTPLELSPDVPHAHPGLPDATRAAAVHHDRPREKAIDADFRYGEDPFGIRCPLGAHIRRANPRDGLRNQEDPPSEAARSASLDISSHHRIMRRGRLYGPTWRPEDGEPCPPALRGLHFVSLSASIENQFEFVQQTWISSTKFLGLYDEVDPTLGVGHGPEGACGFSLQRSGEAFRTRIENVPRFILVRGGAYFFLPTLSAFSMLASLE